MTNHLEAAGDMTTQKPGPTGVTASPTPLTGPTVGAEMVTSLRAVRPAAVLAPTA